ncbi:MAG: isochorismate synthase [Nibricoccus sp.]
MTILPLNPAENSSPEALHAFLTQCQTAARKAGHAQLVSISLEVDGLDPLAVLESIFEPSERHFYVERPAESLALAGAEAVVVFTASGRSRFSDCQRFIDDTLANTIAVGDMSAPLSGPHFFSAFAFSDEAEVGEPFEAATVFVPRWQVGVSGGRTVAVANLLIEPNASLEPSVERLWRARQKFGTFDYAAPDFSVDGPSDAISVSEVGGEGSYEKAVREALKKISNGEFRKIVLARAKDLRASSAFHPLQVLNGLRQRYPDCFSFSVANGKGQSLIGATPERLVQVRNRTLLTEALAGSISRGDSASEDAALASTLLHSQKDLAEHTYVLDSIVRWLQSLGLEPSAPNRASIRRLANVQHLHTPVTAPLMANVRLLDVVSRLHPTPAVGGSPREAALPCIRKLEAFPRGLYAGAIGWINARGEGEFFVGLRSALIDGVTARLYAGAGVVAGSEAEKEKSETELKFSAMQASLLDKTAGR